MVHGTDTDLENGGQENRGRAHGRSLRTGVLNQNDFFSRVSGRESVLAQRVMGYGVSAEPVLRSRGLRGAWSAYQLADAISLCCAHDRPARPQSFCWLSLYRKRYPHSVATAYLEEEYGDLAGQPRRNRTGTKRPVNYTTLLRVIDIHYSPSETTLVVHLRLGDVLEVVDDVQRMWETGRGTTYRNGYRYLFDRSCYETVQIPAVVDSVVLVGSSTHGGRSRRKTETYIALVAGHFGSLGLGVRWRGEHWAPDDELSYMSRAAYFLGSGGGFSVVAAALVSERGGTVLQSANC